MTAEPPTRLPRGRHGLTREQVEGSQRERLLTAMAEAMSERGFAATPVEDVIKRAGVSRESFYRLFRSKADCFMAAFELAAERLMLRVAEHDSAGGTPVERFDRIFTAYLDALCAQPALARLFVIEVHAAGPAAIQRRLELQRGFVDAVAEVLDVHTDDGRFACQMIVAATSAMLAGPLAAGDLDALHALRPAVVGHVRILAERGVLR